MKKYTSVFLVIFLGCVYLSDAQTWSAVGTGVTGFINSLASYNGSLYAGGTIVSAGGTAVNDIAKWSGSAWSSPATGVSGNVTCMTVYNGELIAAGTFNTASGVTTLNIARWNGTSWAALGAGMTQDMEALTVYNGEVYATGTWILSGTAISPHIGHWNGTGNIIQMTGINSSSQFRALATYNNELYAAGDFNTIGGVAASGIARWNGSNWSACGPGFSGAIFSLCVFNGELYVGGEFNSIGGIAANSIAKWNGTSWSTLGGGVTGTIGTLGLGHIDAMAVYNGALYAGGTFDTAGTGAAKNIARWDGTSWSALGSGITGGVIDMSEFNGDLYVGGDLSAAGGIPASNIARWNFPTSQTVLTLQPSGATGVDATISNFPGEATTNYGTNQEFVSESKSISFAPYAKRGLIRFDLSSIPANATVISAYLSMYAYNPGTGGHLVANNNMGYLFRVTQPWNESTVTWNTQPTYTNADTVFFPISDSSNQNYLNIDLRNQIQMQVASAATNYGFLFKQKYECTCNGRMIFGSSDNASASLRPKLVVTYAVCSGAPPPATLTPSGSPTICYGTSQILTANAGAGFVYQWYRNGAFIIGGSSNTYSASVSGAYTVKVTNAQGCTAISAATNLVVSLENAMITTPTGNTTTGCANGGLTMTATASGAGNSYLWRLNTIPIGAPNLSTYTTPNAGNYSCTITNSGNTCSYLTNTINSQVQVANMTTSGSYYFCNNNSFDMMVQSLNIGGNATYQWTNNGVNIPGANSFAYGATTTGNYQCIIDDYICAGNTYSPVYPVTTGVPPQIEIYSPSGASPVNLCGGQTMDMWIRDANTHEDWALGGAQWYKDGVPIPFGGGIPVLTMVSDGAVYTCDLTTSCGVSTSPYPGMVVHSTNPGTPLPLIDPTGSVNWCGPAPITTPSSQIAPWVSYQWQKNGVNISGATSDFYNVTTSGSYRCIFGNGCGALTSAATQVTVSTAVPATPGSITTTGGAVKVCPGEVRTYSIAAVSGATSYTWTPCAGSTINSGQNTNSVTIQYNINFPTSDTLRVVAHNYCGNSAQRKLKISRNTPGTPAAITGNNYSVCNLSGVPYSVTNVSGMTYSWSFNTGTATVASGQGTSAITANYGVGFLTATMSVTANNACGASTARLKTIYAKPATPASITGSTSVCLNQQDVPYSIAPLANVTNYTWTGPTGSHVSDGSTTSAGTTLVTIAASVTVDYATTAGTVKVRGNNSCASGSYKSLTVAIVCREGDFASGISETRVFPNPAVNNFTVETDDTSMPFDLEIYDAIGRLVFSEVNLNSGYQVDVNGWADGLYSVVVRNGNNKTTLRLIVQAME